MKYNTKSRTSVPRKVYAVRLPEAYPWKVLSKLTQDLKEYLSYDSFIRIDRIIRDKDVDRYIELSEEWGLQSIALTGLGIAEMRTKYLLASLLKKFQFGSDKESRVARATEIFSAAESACKTYNLVDYKSLERPETEWSVEILHYARLFFKKLLGDHLSGHLSMLNRSRHGPGATIDTSKGNTSQYHKFAEWPYSCTIDALRYARFAIETDPRWFGALQNSYRERFGIQKQLPLNMSKFWTRVFKVVDGNRITFVPKDARKERTIAIEPTLNLFLQLGVDGFIRRRLKRFGVDLDSQKKNQELARLGSMPNCSQHFVTVDLSAASDSISMKLCELLLPKDWYNYLINLRSPTGELGGNLVNYEKISSMGNGYTFALESAIFTALIYAVSKADRGDFRHSEFAVFGDDLIVDQKLYFKLVEALRLAGFRINHEKTFSYGPIRESCGTDWFHGSPLRPVFLDSIPTNVSELFCDYNRIKRLLSLRWDIEESDTLDLIRTWIPEVAQLLLGPYSDEDYDSYLHCSEPVGSYREWVYKYKRIIIVPLPRPGKDFLFRKLMHDLRGKPITQQWGKRLTGKGSRFTVTCRNAMAVRYKYSVASYWRNKYVEGPTSV